LMLYNRIAPGHLTMKKIYKKLGFFISTISPYIS